MHTHSHPPFVVILFKKNSMLLTLAKFYCSNKLTPDSQWLDKTKIIPRSYFCNTGWQGLCSTQPFSEPS